MSTDQLLSYLTNKKLMSYDLMDLYFFGYLKGLIERYHEATYRRDGSFDTITTVVGAAIGQVSVSGSFSATDGIGHIIEFDPPDSRIQNVDFENTDSIDYHIGLRSVELVDELDINPRTGQPEYRRKQENVGTLDEPDSVVDNGSNLTLIVDSVTESGHSHAGRTVRVWLNTPVATSWANAYEDVIVAWDGSNNKITTTGLLGQVSGFVSTTASDYSVCEIGPVFVRLSTQDLRGVSGVFFMAKVTGNTSGLPTIDQSDQNILTGSLSDLADITRYCPHMDLKVSVRADASDSGEDQVRVESAAAAIVWGVDEAGKHYLPNGIQRVPLDDASALGSQGFLWNGQSIVGAINQAMTGLQYAFGPTVCAGFDYLGSGGANEIDVGAGTAWVPGNTYISGGMQKYLSPTNITGLTSDGTEWIYLDPGGYFSHTTTKATAYSNRRLPLFEITMTAGTPSLAADLRYKFGEIHKKGVVTVGDTPGSNFTNLQAAFDYINSFWDQDQGDFPSVELWIVSDIDVGTTAVSTGSSVNGLVVRGMNYRGRSNGRGATISYGVTNTDFACVIVEADNIAWHNIRFESQIIAAVGVTPTCIKQTTDGSIDGGLFYGCTFTSSTDDLKWPFELRSARDWENVKVEKCTIEIGDTFSTTRYLALYAGDWWSWVDCAINAGPSDPAEFTQNVAYMQSNEFVRCSFANFASSTAKWQGSEPSSALTFVDCSGDLGIISSAVLRNCDFTDTRITNSSANDRVIIFGGRLRGSNLIYKEAENELIIIGCHLNPMYGSTNNYLIGGTNPSNITMDSCYAVGTGTALVTNSPITLSDNCTISNCKFGPYRSSTNQSVPFIALLANSTDVRIINNEIDASWYTYGVYIPAGSHRCKVIGNRIENPTSDSADSAAGVYTLAYEALIAGNHFRNIGDTTYGGIGVLVGSTALSTKILGNTFYIIEGSAIWLAGTVTSVIIANNSMYDVGNSLTNPLLGVAAPYGILLDESVSYNIVECNVIDTVTGNAIHVIGTRNNIIGNSTRNEGADGVELATGSTFNVCQLNNVIGGIDNNGTQNLVGASVSNNNRE